MQLKNGLMLALALAVIPLAACQKPENQAAEEPAVELASAEPTPSTEPAPVAATEALTPEEVTPEEKVAVQEAMKKYVDTLIADNNGFMPMLHEGKVLELELAFSEKYPDAFHEGVVKYGGLYTSCADFVDPKTGDKYDIDFLVSMNDDSITVVQPLVHSLNGVKSPYDLEHG